GDGHGHVAVSGDEHDGDGRVALDELFLQFQPAHARLADVDEQYADAVGVVALQELFGAADVLDAVAVGFEQPAKGIAYGFIVIDDVDQAWCLGNGHACNSWESSDGIRTCGATRGRVNRKMVPPSGLASAHSRP